MANPHISFVTIGVKDLERMSVFYRDTLGWQMEKEEQGVRFFKMNPGLILALFGEQDLAEDIGLKDWRPDDQDSFKRMSLAINLPSKEAVDSYFELLQNKGVTIQKAPQSVFWGGYNGYFKDPEDNYWEVAYNPFL